jgi:plasmid maintenance system antidote protein VapI
MNTLDAYMRKHGISDGEMAERVGRDRTRVNRIRRGLERPSLEMAVRLERVTGGAVMPSHFFDDEAA